MAGVERGRRIPDQDRVRHQLLQALRRGKNIAEGTRSSRHA